MQVFALSQRPAVIEHTKVDDQQPATLKEVEAHGEKQATEQEGPPSAVGVNISEILECIYDDENESKDEQVEDDSENISLARIATPKIEQKLHLKKGGGEGVAYERPTSKLLIDEIDVDLEALESASVEMSHVATTLKNTLCTAADAAADAAAVDVSAKAQNSAAEVAAQSYALLDGMAEGIDAALQDIDSMFTVKESMTRKSEENVETNEVQEIVGKEAQLVELQNANTKARGSESNCAVHWRHVRRFTSMLQ